MESYPLISVVMCTYNGAAYVGQQLQSILEQTYPNTEIIICDDASIDNTMEVLQPHIGKERNIQLYQNEINVGFNKNFEQALKRATGNWIAIADQDDIWLPQKLMTLYHLITPQTLLIHSYNAEFSGENMASTIVDRSRVRFQGADTTKLLFYNTVTGHTILLHKKLLHYAFPFPDGVYYDWWLAVQASVYGTIALSEEVLVLYRQHTSNASRYFNRHQGQENKKAFFKERIHTLQAFLQIPGLSLDDKQLLQQYILLIRKEWKKTFSVKAFFFFYRHAATAFYYRRKPFMPWYYFKYSYKRATMKIKHWM